jgi:hypothetical protein
VRPTKSDAMNIRLICRWDQPTRDGRFPVCFKVNNSKFLTGEFITNGKAWDQKAQCVNARYGGADQINKRLLRKKNAFTSILDAQVNFDVKKIRALFERYLKDPDALDKLLVSDRQTTGGFHSLIDSIIEDHRTDWSPGYIRRFITIRTKFLEFDPDFTPGDLTVDWWRRFVSWCVEEKDNSNNTLNTDSKVIQSLIPELQKRGHKMGSDLEEIAWKYIEPEITSQPWERILKIAELDFSGHDRETYEDSRVLWLLGAFTGRRWGEIEKMDEKISIKMARIAGVIAK